MRQQINLYQPMFRMQKKVFSAVTMIQIFIFFIFIFAGMYAYELYFIGKYRAQLKNLNSDLQQLSVQLEKLRVEQTSRAKSELLKKEIARVSNELAQRRNIQQILSTQTFGNNKGFSSYMEAFARQHVEGSWLTTIRVMQGGESVGLEGKTMSSEYVPIYVQQLSNEQIFAGVSFNSMELQRGENEEDINKLIFKLATN